MKKVFFLVFVFAFALGITAFGFRGNQSASPSFGLSLATQADSTKDCPYLSGEWQRSTDFAKDCPAISKDDCCSDKAGKKVQASVSQAEDDGSGSVNFAVLGEESEDDLPVCECPHCAEAGKCICDVNKCGCTHCKAIREKGASSGQTSADSSDEEPYAPAQGICPFCGMPWDEKGECKMCHSSKEHFNELAFKKIQSYDTPAGGFIYTEVTGPYETSIPQAVGKLQELRDPSLKIRWSDGIYAVYLNNPRKTPADKLKTAVGVACGLGESENPKLSKDFMFKFYKDKARAIGIEVQGEYGSPQVEAYWYPLFDYVEVNAYEVAGPAIEIFLDDPGKVEKSKLRTRLLIPVKEFTGKPKTPSAEAGKPSPSQASQAKPACPCFKGQDCQCPKGCGCAHCTAS